MQLGDLRRSPNISKTRLFIPRFRNCLNINVYFRQYAIFVITNKSLMV